MDNNNLNEATQQISALIKTLEKIIADIGNVVNNSEIKNDIPNETTPEEILLTTKQIPPHQEKEYETCSSDPHQILADRSKPLPKGSERKFVPHTTSPIVETFKYMFNAGPLLKEEQSKLPAPNNKHIGNLEAFARDDKEQELVKECTEQLSVDTEPQNKTTQSSGCRPLISSPLMKPLPSYIVQIVCSLNFNNPRLRLAANDVITALARFDNLLMEEEETPAFAKIDEFLARYVKFEPWGIYAAAFAILMDRCGLKDTKREEKEG